LVQTQGLVGAMQRGKRVKLTPSAGQHRDCPAGLRGAADRKTARCRCRSCACGPKGLPGDALSPAWALPTASLTPAAAATATHVGADAAGWPRMDSKVQVPQPHKAGMRNMQLLADQCVHTKRPRGVLPTTVHDTHCGCSPDKPGTRRRSAACLCTHGPASKRCGSPPGDCTHIGSIHTGSWCAEVTPCPVLLLSAQATHSSP
jgi:hypothetical protein